MQALENAAFAAWPAAIHVELEGWRLQLDAGYTKRANSLNATEHARPLHPALLGLAEQRFAEHGLRAVVRVASFAARPADAALLAARGYCYGDASLVLQRSLVPPVAEPTWPVQWLPGPGEWLAVFARLGKQAPAEAAAHLAILQRIAHPAAWGLVGTPQAPLCCGLAVRAGRWVGLFDILTSSTQRQRGLAQALCSHLLQWGQAQGAAGAFLQVGAQNGAALRLYERLGFKPAYGYGYWVK